MILEKEKGKAKVMIILPKIFEMINGDLQDKVISMEKSSNYHQELQLVDLVVKFYSQDHQQAIFQTKILHKDLKHGGK